MAYNKALVGIAGSCAVITAIVVTQSPLPLWGLLLVALMVESCGKES